MDEMLEFIDKNEKDSLEYDEVLVRRLVEQVMVYDEHIPSSLNRGLK
jgi:site-specific DNA recombinase